MVVNIYFYIYINKKMMENQLNLIKSKTLFSQLLLADILCFQGFAFPVLGLLLVGCMIYRHTRKAQADTSLAVRIECSPLFMSLPETTSLRHIFLTVLMAEVCQKELPQNVVKILYGQSVCCQNLQVCHCPPPWTLTAELLSLM